MSDKGKGERIKGIWLRSRVRSKKSNMKFGSKRKYKVINVGNDQALETMLNNYASEG